MGLPDRKMSLISTGSFPAPASSMPRARSTHRLGTAQPLASPKGSLGGLCGAKEMCPWLGTAVMCQPGPCPINHRGPDPAGTELCCCPWQPQGARPSLLPPLPHPQPGAPVGQLQLPEVQQSILCRQSDACRTACPTLIPTPEPGQCNATGTGDSSAGALSNLCTLPEHRILSKKISTSKSQPGSPERARAAPYKWENGHKRKAAGAGRAACPAGIGHATGTGPSQDHSPVGTGTFWHREGPGAGCSGSTPALSTALPVLSPQQGSPRAPPAT